VEHGHTGEEHGGEREDDAEECEADQARVHGAQPRDSERERSAGGERGSRDDEGELDHGENL
jgi:hypothetical protein